MAWGAPVVVRSGLAMEKVVGDAGLPVVSGLNELAGALKTVLDDESLSRSLAAKASLGHPHLPGSVRACDTVVVHKWAASVKSP